ncbi:MAG: transposase [Gemmatimonadales bacterium]
MADALRHFDGIRYRMRAWVVMDDHVHCVVTPYPQRKLCHLVHSWKSFTAHRLVVRFSRPPPVWQDESFDRLVRNSSALEAIIAYVVRNPLRRWPELTHYEWVWWSREE